MSARYRSEFAGGPGQKPDEARLLRRAGLAEQSGQTGGSDVKPNEAYAPLSPAEADYVDDRAKALQESIDRNDGIHKFD